MSRCIIGATWLDSPHLNDAAKADLLNSYQKYQVDARTKGIPQLGSGAVYPFAESDIIIQDFPIPSTYRRAFGMDTARAGVTAAVWGALDPETDIAYIISDYRRSMAEVAVHALAFLARGAWIPGVGDASAVLDEDRVRYLDEYRKHGLDLELAVKAVETGIQSVYDRFSSGRLKIFASCRAMIEELRRYRRDESGRIVKQADHCCDSLRYLVYTGLRRAKVEPQPDPRRQQISVMGRSGQIRRGGRWQGG